MGVGDLAEPVVDSTPANHPVSKTGADATNQLDVRLRTLERSGNTVLAGLISDIITRMDALTGTFIVATTVPFTVKLDGSLTAVPGLKHVGSSYVVGTAGRYILDPDNPDASVQKPLCFPTA